jgi:hypothetical protein
MAREALANQTTRYYSLSAFLAQHFFMHGYGSGVGGWLYRGLRWNIDGGL